MKIHSFQNYREPERPQLFEKSQQLGGVKKKTPPAPPVALMKLNERAREDRWSKMKKKEEDVLG